MKKILVTEANGFIGKNVTKKLLENNSVDVYCRELKRMTLAGLKIIILIKISLSLHIKIQLMTMS